MLWKRDARPDAAADPAAIPDVGASERASLRRSNYRQPTDSGQQGLGAVLEWGTAVAGHRSELHLVLFMSLGGTLEEWRDPAPNPSADELIRATGQQAANVLEWLAGRDRMQG